MNKDHQCTENTKLKEVQIVVELNECNIYIFIHQTHGSNDNKDNKNEYYEGLQTHKKQLH